MKLGALALCATLLVTRGGFAQTDAAVRQQRFEGPAARKGLCSSILKTRQHAEIEGRLDFTAKVESVAADASPTFIARISTGPAYAIRRIQFSGHRKINDTTLRRALTAFERDMLNIQHLRESLTQIDKLGAFEPLTLDDVIVNRLDDGVSVDLTIQLRERKPRWWSISGLLLPGNNPLRASVASRLPPWGRGVFEMATYFVSLNTIGLRGPFLALGRPLVPGQEWLSGFAITSLSSPRAMATHYARTHVLHAAGRMLDRAVDDPFIVDIESASGSPQTPLVCKPPKPRLWWLRLAARQIVAIYS